MRRLVMCVMLALSCALPAIPARAQDQLNARDRREAKRLFDQAHLAYRRGDYEEAILKWQESFELSKEPLIFESIANAYERLGDLESAHKYLSQWREHAPKSEQKELDSRLESLSSRLEEKRATERKRQDEEEKLRRAQDAERRREDAARLPQHPDSEEGASTSPMEIAGWTLVGVGGAAVICGVIVDAVAVVKRPSEADACSEAGGNLYCRDDQRHAIESSNMLAIAGDVTWIAGAVIAATGIALVIVASQTESEEAATIELAPGALRGRF